MGNPVFTTFDGVPLSRQQTELLIDMATKHPHKAHPKTVEKLIQIGFLKRNDNNECQLTDLAYEKFLDLIPLL